MDRRPRYHYDDPPEPGPSENWSIWLGGFLCGFIVGVILASVLGLVQ